MEEETISKKSQARAQSFEIGIFFNIKFLSVYYFFEIIIIVFCNKGTTKEEYINNQTKKDFSLRTTTRNATLTEDREATPLEPLSKLTKIQIELV